MLKLLLFIILILNSLLAVAQDFQIINRNRDMRAGFVSSVGFTMKKKFDSVELHVSQGKVERDRNAVRILPESPGKDSLFIKFFRKRTLIYSDTVVFDIIAPEVFPTIGTADLLKNRKTNLTNLKTFGGVMFYIRVNDFHWEGAAIESYRFSIIRKDSCIYSSIEHSNRFSDKLKSDFSLLKSGDIILVSEVALKPYFKYVNILPGVFEIE